MKTFHQLISRRLWFLLFNAITVLALIVTGRLRWSAESAITSFIALLVVNIAAAISARNFPEWK
jgi:hypothetical protein